MVSSSMPNIDSTYFIMNYKKFLSFVGPDDVISILDIKDGRFVHVKDTYILLFHTYSLRDICGWSGNNLHVEIVLLFQVWPIDIILKHDRNSSFVHACANQFQYVGSSKGRAIIPHSPETMIKLKKKYLYTGRAPLRIIFQTRSQGGWVGGWVVSGGSSTHPPPPPKKKRKKKEGQIQHDCKIIHA